MTTKENIVRKLIAASEKERSEIVELINASPLIGIIEGREKAQEILSKYEIGDPRLVQEITFLATEEKRLFAIAEKQKDTIALIERRVKLDMELTSLHGELYLIEKKLVTEYETEVLRLKKSCRELSGAQIGPELILKAYKDAISPMQLLNGLIRKSISQ